MFPSPRLLQFFIEHTTINEYFLVLVFVNEFLCRFLYLQIKIWFQNRRTKWKRKYTNDVELLAQQYYSSLGIPAPRPIFVEDRLW